MDTIYLIFFRLYTRENIQHEKILVIDFIARHYHNYAV